MNSAKINQEWAGRILEREGDETAFSMAVRPLVLEYAKPYLQDPEAREALADQVIRDQVKRYRLRPIPTNLVIQLNAQVCLQYSRFGNGWRKESSQAPQSAPEKPEPVRPGTPEPVRPGTPESVRPGTPEPVKPGTPKAEAPAADSELGRRMSAMEDSILQLTRISEQLSRALQHGPETAGEEEKPKTPPMAPEAAPPDTPVIPPSFSAVPVPAPEKAPEKPPEGPAGQSGTKPPVQAAPAEEKAGRGSAGPGESPMSDSTRVMAEGTRFDPVRTALYVPADTRDPSMVEVRPKPEQTMNEPDDEDEVRSVPLSILNTLLVIVFIGLLGLIMVESGLFDGLL